MKRRKDTQKEPFALNSVYHPSINLDFILFQMIVKNMPNFPKLIQFIFSETTFKSNINGHYLQPLRNSTDLLIAP